MHSVLLWPAHDGMDYPFSVDYRATWERMVDHFIEIAEYAGDMKLAIEPKTAGSAPEDVGQQHGQGNDVGQ